MNTFHIAVLFSVLTVTALAGLSEPSYAHPHAGTVQADSHSHQGQTEIIPINDMIGLEKTTLTFHASPSNTLPWGYVEGKIANPVSDYPVIIQMYQNGEAVHFAQTDLTEDGTYEYKFRVRNVVGDDAVRLFEGNYSVLVFTVVYLHPDLSSL